MSGFGNSSGVGGAPRQPFGSFSQQPSLGATTGNPEFGGVFGTTPRPSSFAQLPAPFGTTAFGSGFGSPPPTNSFASFSTTTPPSASFGGTYGSATSGNAVFPSGIGFGNYSSNLGSSGRFGQQQSAFQSQQQQTLFAPQQQQQNLFQAQQGSLQLQSSIASPFGGAPVGTATGITFGTSANIVSSTAPATDNSAISTFGTGFGSGNTTVSAFGASSGNGGFGMHSESGFGMSGTSGFDTSQGTSNVGRFGASSFGVKGEGYGTFGSDNQIQDADIDDEEDDDGMADDNAGPLGSKTSSEQPYQPFMGQQQNQVLAPHHAFPSKLTGFNSGAFLGVTNGEGQTPVLVQDSVVKDDYDSELSRLKAKIEEKKRILAEKKMAAAKPSEAESFPTPSVSPVPTNQSSFFVTTEGRTSSVLTTNISEPNQSSPRTHLNALAPSFTPNGPPTGNLPGRDFLGNDLSAIAEKNTVRFASDQNKLYTSLLPPDLVQKSIAYRQEKSRKQDALVSDTEVYLDETTNIEDATGRDMNAKSLLGTCLYMCPDEELLRRESESDIQLLETPDPGGIHPKNWNLRNTTVKRFRRSAADFKLNIPELVRPPHILERVCGYLEEWVMERDRQGTDPRYAQTASQIPPPLDVYQFIWDRTRMIRKDFILQNYIGNGGNCSASAVRCHERIARWHAMCEHQLSHLPEFVAQQSQQNIQELGQTMKTLNFYYDDSQGRSTLELENLSDAKHGCDSTVVMGKNPVDYDGSPLMNNESSSTAMNRIIGPSGTGIASFGTAEPEMRGLYILLTIDNDGGMEVLKYAGRLCVERPEVFNSKPVQLALSVYKAKKENNYARFFSIMRAPSTPYLFACIMFKYVENMRKVAFRIMSKSFGARKKDTGEPMYDSYPLRDIVSLLCFEGLDEARNACRHYNIVVEDVTGQSDGDTKPNSSLIETIFWRRADFKEPRDPTKGTVIPLPPRKMVRTIESKVCGVTRLGICRGEVSGSDAMLARPVLHRGTSVTISPSLLKGRGFQLQQMGEADRICRQKEYEEAQAAAARADQERIKLEEARRKDEESKRRKEMIEQQAAAQEAERRDRLLQEKREKEEAAKQEEEQRRLIEQEAKATAELAAAEEKRKREEEANRVLIENEMARKRAEEVEKERQRQLWLARQREEELLRYKLKQEEEETRRREEEERQYLRKLQREQEEEEARIRKIKKEEANQMELKWERKLSDARKLLVLHKWRNRVYNRRYSMDSTLRSLDSIDPTYHRSLHTPLKHIKEKSTLHDGTLTVRRDPLSQPSSNFYEELFYRLGTNFTWHIDLCGILNNLFSKVDLCHSALNTGGTKLVILMKIAVIVPDFDDEFAQSIVTTMRTWLNARLQFGRVFLKLSGSMEFRTVVVNNSVDVDCFKSCDAALLIIPPANGASGSSFRVPSSAFDCISKCPTFVLNFDNGEDDLYTEQVRSIITETIGAGSGEHDKLRPRCGEVYVGNQLVKPDDVELALLLACEGFVEEFVATVSDNTGLCPRAPVVECISLNKLGGVIMKSALWRGLISDSPPMMSSPRLQRAAANYREQQALSLCRNSLQSLVDEISEIHTNLLQGPFSAWPAMEFTESSRSFIPEYFGAGSCLRVDWLDTLAKPTFEHDLWSFHQSLKTCQSADRFLKELLSNATSALQQECGLMLQQKQLRRCLDVAMTWHIENGGKDQLIFLPLSEAMTIVARTMERQFADSPEADTTALLCAKFDVEVLQYQQSELLNFQERLVQGSTPSEHWKSSDSISSFATPRSKRNVSKDSVVNSNDVESHSVKRHRPLNSSNSPRPTTSQELEKSKNFTSRLEELLSGQTTIDLAIGNTMLSDILRENEDRIRIL